MVDENPSSLHMCRLNVRGTDNAIPIPQEGGCNVHNTTVSVCEEDLIEVIIRPIIGVARSRLIKLLAHIQCMPSIRLLLEWNSEDRHRGVLLEIVEEQLVLLHSDGRNERGIKDAISIADIILGDVKCITVGVSKNAGRRHVETVGVNNPKPSPTSILCADANHLFSYLHQCMFCNKCRYIKISTFRRCRNFKLLRLLIDRHKIAMCS